MARLNEDLEAVKRIARGCEVGLRVLLVRNIHPKSSSTISKVVDLCFRHFREYNTYSSSELVQRPCDVYIFFFIEKAF